MATRGAHSRLPYALRVTYAPYGGLPEHFTLGLRKDFRRAMGDAHAVTLAWLRLVGGQYPVLFWSIVDTRDGTVHHPTLYTERGASDGTNQESRGRLF